MGLTVFLGFVNVRLTSTFDLPRNMAMFSFPYPGHRIAAFLPSPAFAPAPVPFSHSLPRLRAQRSTNELTPLRVVVFFIFCFQPLKSTVIFLRRAFCDVKPPPFRFCPEIGPFFSADVLTRLSRPRCRLLSFRGERAFLFRHVLTVFFAYMSPPLREVAVGPWTCADYFAPGQIPHGDAVLSFLFKRRTVRRRSPSDAGTFS